MLRNILCFIRLHKWQQSRKLNIIDGFPPPFTNYRNPTRKCIHCSKSQSWLPGYGGSEWGCWI